jgi:hypothetical protein
VEEASWEETPPGFPGHGVNGFCRSRHTRHARREERGGLRLLFATEQGEKVTHGISPGRCARFVTDASRVTVGPRLQ